MCKCTKGCRISVLQYSQKKTFMHVLSHSFDLLRTWEAMLSYEIPKLAQSKLRAGTPPAQNVANHHVLWTRVPKVPATPVLVGTQRCSAPGLSNPCWLPSHPAKGFRWSCSLPGRVNLCQPDIPQRDELLLHCSRISCKTYNIYPGNPFLGDRGIVSTEKSVINLV